MFQCEFDDFVKGSVLSEFKERFETMCLYEENIIYVPVGMERFYVVSTSASISSHIVSIFVSIAVPTT